MRLTPAELAMFHRHAMRRSRPATVPRANPLFVADNVSENLGSALPMVQGPMRAESGDER